MINNSTNNWLLLHNFQEYDAFCKYNKATSEWPITAYSGWHGDDMASSAHVSGNTILAWLIYFYINELQVYNK